MSLPPLDHRLISVASLVRQGAVFADIGTDHAYLPLFLLEQGKILRAVCTDIAEGPLAGARMHASGTPALSRMTFVRTDGLDGMEGYGLTDIAICGMGGELIADILARAPFIKDRNIRLILQPMTKQEHLRRCLCAQGFDILQERYSQAEGKFYVSMLTSYSGTNRELTQEQAILGIGCADSCTDAYRGYLLRKRQAFARAAEGKCRGGQDGASEREAVRIIDKRLADLC